MVLSLCASETAHAQRIDERTPQEMEDGGLKASRHATTTAGVNTFIMPWAAALWLDNGVRQTQREFRAASFTIGSVNVAAAVANLGWLVVAGKSLKSYRNEWGPWMSVRHARLHVGLTSIDTAFRLSGVVGGAIALSRRNPVGNAFLWPNLVLLPFHAWAIVATSRELKHRKRETRPVARRVQPTASGFRF